MAPTENHLGVSPAAADATRSFVFNHSMLRIKNPEIALDFYTCIMGMWVRKLDFPESEKLVTGLQACRSNMFWKGFTFSPKTLA